MFCRRVLYRVVNASVANIAPPPPPGLTAFIPVRVKTTTIMDLPDLPAAINDDEALARVNNMSSSVVERNDNELQSTIASPTQKSLRYKFGGDINMATIVGTVTGVKIFPMKSNPDREWALVFVQTRTRRHQPRQQSPIDSNPADDQVDDHSIPKQDNSLSSSSTRLHLFQARAVSFARRLQPGDRLLATGFLTYYANPLGSGSDQSTSSDRTSWICALTAQRIVSLGSLGTRGSDNDPLASVVEEDSQGAL